MCVISGESIMQLNRFLACSVCSCFFTASVLAQDCNDMKGTWFSPKGAEFTITSIHADRKMEGTFKSPPEYHPDGPHNCTGYITTTELNASGNSAITFSVLWLDNTVSSWTGTCKLEDGTPTITSNWIRAKPDADKSYEHSNIGATTFTPIPPQAQ